MKKVLAVILLASFLLFIAIDRIGAVNLSDFSVTDDTANDRLFISVSNSDFDAGITQIEYNYGRGWNFVSPILGTNFGDQNIFAQVDYTNLPNFPIKVRFRIVDSNNSIYQMPTFNYTGDATGCDYNSCPVGAFPPFNLAVSTGNPQFELIDGGSFGTDSSNSFFLDISSYEDVALVAVAHYRSNTESIDSLTFSYEDFEFACKSNEAEYVTELWYLSAGSFMSGDVLATWTDSVEDGFLYVSVISRADMNRLAGEINCNGSVSDNHMIDIPTNSNQLVFGSAMSYSGGGNTIAPTGPDMIGVAMTTVGNVTLAVAYQEPADSSITTFTWEGSQIWPMSAGIIAINGYQGSDLTPPEISFSSEPAANEGPAFTVSGTATDPEATIGGVGMRLYNNTTATEVFASTVDADDGTYDENSEDFTRLFSSLAGGDYDLDVTVHSTAGISQTYHYDVIVSSDSISPEFTVINLGQAPMIDTTPTWNGSVTDSSTVASVEYSIFNQDLGTTEVNWTAVTSSDGAVDESSETFSFTSTSLSDGAKLILLRASDSIGNDSSEFTVDRVVIDAVDASAPILIVKDVVPTSNPDPDLKISGKVKDDTSEKTSNITNIYYRLDAGAWTSVVPLDGNLNDEIEESFEVQFSSLALGAHSVDFRAVDASGNDTNLASLNVTKNFTTIIQPGGLTPATFETVLDFDSNTYIDFADSEGLIWGNGRLRLAEEFDPEGTSIDTDTIKYGPKYGFGLGGFNIDRSAANGYWVTKANGLFAFHDLGSDTEYEFDTEDYFGTDGVIAYDIVEKRNLNNEYIIWIAAGDSILSVNFGTSIVDGSGDHYTIWNSPTSNVNIVELDDRNPSNLAIFTKGDNALYRLDGFTYGDSVNGSQPWISWPVSDGYVTEDIIAIYLDKADNEIWVAENTDGVSRIDENGTPTDASDDSTIVTYSALPGIFDIGEDAHGNIFMIGNAGLIVITDYGTPSNPGDDTIETLASGSDLNIDAGGRAVYLPGTFPVEDQYFVSNRAGEIFYISTNGTYDDSFDDQIIRLPLLNIYPTEVKDFYMPDENTVVAVMFRSGVWSFDLNRLFVENGYATTKIDPQVSNYLNADFVRLEDFTRIDSTDAVVTYKASTSSGTTLLSLNPGESVEFPGEDHRVVFRIDMFRGSTPVLTNVTFSYAAYPDSGQELGDFTITNLPSNVNANNAFSFTVNAFDTLDNPMLSDVNATIELRRSLDNAIISSFNISDVVISNGTITIPNAVADVIGNHYLVVQSGSVEVSSAPFLFVAPTPENNNGNSGGGYVFQGTGQSGTIQENDENEEVEDIPVSGNLPESDVRIDKFTVTEKVVDGKLVLIIEWKVSNAKSIEISGVGQNLSSEGKFELPIEADQIIQIVALGKDGKQIYSSYTATNVQEKIAQYSPKTYLNTILPLLIIALISGIFIVLDYASVGRFFIPLVFIFSKQKTYSGVVYCESKENIVPFALVYITIPSGDVIEVRTDEYGKYLFETTEPGDHTFKINMSGYLVFKENYNAERVGPFGKDIYLRKIAVNENSSIAEKIYSRREGIYNFLNIFTVLSLGVGILICIGQILIGFSLVVFILGVIYASLLGIVLWKSRMERVSN